MPRIFDIFRAGGQRDIGQPNQINEQPRAAGAARNRSNTGALAGRIALGVFTCGISEGMRALANGARARQARRARLDENMQPNDIGQPNQLDAQPRAGGLGLRRPGAGALAGRIVLGVFTCGLSECIRALVNVVRSRQVDAERLDANRQVNVNEPERHEMAPLDN